MKRINKILRKINSLFEVKVKFKKRAPLPEDWKVPELPGIDSKLVIPSHPLIRREGSLTYWETDFLSEIE